MHINILLENLKPHEDVLEAAIDEVENTAGTRQAHTAERFCRDLEVQRALYRIAERLGDSEVANAVLKDIVIHSPAINRMGFVTDVDEILKRLGTNQEVLSDDSYWARQNRHVEKLIGQYSQGTS